MKKTLLILSLLLVSCSSLKDGPACVEIEPSRGKCAMIISGKTFDVDDSNLFEDKTWFELKRKSLVVPVSTYVKIKTFLRKVCKRYNCEKDFEVSEKALEEITAPE